jgi:hypothetical protein
MDKREQALNEIKEAVPGLSAEERETLKTDLILGCLEKPLDDGETSW